MSTHIVRSNFTQDGTSLLVENMSAEADEMETYPVLIGDEVTYFHSVEGGFDSNESVHVVGFVHEVQGVGSPARINPNQVSHDFEAHLNNYYNLDVLAVSTNDTYPDDDYIMSVKVQTYRSGPQSFAAALTEEIDMRERSERL